MSSNRDYAFDLIRAIAIVWIVCIWHLTNYYPSQSIFHSFVMNRVGNDVTTIVLSTFTLLSGLFLGQKNIACLKDFVGFYKKRIIRFYLFFVVSCITLYFTPCAWGGQFIEDEKQLILTVFGLSCFWGKMPSTLWYMDMLLIFYILTPFILYVTNYKRRVVTCLIIYFIFFSVNHCFNIIDNRVVFYMPFYLLGLLLGPNTLKNYVTCSKARIVILVSCLVVLLLGQFISNYYFRYIYILAGVLLFFLLVLNIKISSKILKIGSVVSYASMLMYLFHRQIYALFFDLNIAVYLAIPFVIGISYFLQIGYDRAVIYIGQK